METWMDELKKAVEAGEREFGRLDAHQTVRHSLIRRCEEIEAEGTKSTPEVHLTDIWANDTQA